MDGLDGWLSSVSSNTIRPRGSSQHGALPVDDIMALDGDDGENGREKARLNESQECRNFRNLRMTVP